jgi:hypothetical protein
MLLYIGASTAPLRHKGEPSITRLLNTVTSLDGSSDTPPPGFAPLRSDAAASIKEMLERLARMTSSRSANVWRYSNTRGERRATARFPAGLQHWPHDLLVQSGCQVPHALVMRSMEMFAAQ